MRHVAVAVAAAALIVLATLPAMGAAASSQTASAPAAGKVDQRIPVVVLDFTGETALGTQLADSVRLRLARHNDEYDVVDQLSTQEKSGPLPPSTPRDQVLPLMRKLAVRMALIGTVEKTGAGVRLELRCIDLTSGDTPTEWTKVFTDNTERARGEIARMVVEAVRGKAEWIPPQYGDEPEPKNLGPPLNTNGDFENSSQGWDRPDNVSTFIVDGPAGRGKILRVRTDLQRDPWLEYTRKIRLGLADPSNPPHIEKDTSYGCVGALEGVHYRSEWIKAEPLQRYWLTADVSGRSADIFFPMIFVKGYRDMADQADGLPEVSLAELKLSPQEFAKVPAERQKEMIAEDAKKHPERYRREVYRWYLPCRDSAAGVWRHYAATCPPRGGLPKNVQWLQIQIYSYWPPGEFLYDNVWLYKDPSQKAPLAEEPARTPSYSRAASQNSGPGGR